jgi:hypothetical protein
MKQLTLYPKTVRYKVSEITITEKLDGSNLGFFKLNGQLLIAQRNNVYFESELDGAVSYKGLRDWLNTFGEILKNELLEGSGVFGEWIGMGQIKYGDNLKHKFYIFAKANINENFEIRNLNYERELLIYPFQSKKIPFFIDIVPEVYTGNAILTLDFLNHLYEVYCVQVSYRKVEGFVINNNNTIQKYIRYKDGKFEDHKTKGD